MTEHRPRDGGAPHADPDRPTAPDRPGLHLVVLYTADLVACRGFYKGIGLEFTVERHGDGPEHLAAELTGGGVIELYPAGRRTPTGDPHLGPSVPRDRVARSGLAAGRRLLRDPEGRTVDLVVH
jgi:catechol 2,3-dioxygenase-like lactoylglutathione lyase family enzyme